jgi:hypothetical protein
MSLSNLAKILGPTLVGYSSSEPATMVAEVSAEFSSLLDESACSGSLTFLRLIRILGSVHWLTDPDLEPDPDPDLFVSGCFFAYYLLHCNLKYRTFTSVFKVQ